MLLSRWRSICSVLERVMVSKSDKLPDRMKLSPFEGMPDELAEVVCETEAGAKTVPSKTFSLSAS